jgi:hypothetical protein
VEPLSSGLATRYPSVLTMNISDFPEWLPSFSRRSPYRTPADASASGQCCRIGRRPLILGAILATLWNTPRVVRAKIGRGRAVACVQITTSCKDEEAADLRCWVSSGVCVCVWCCRRQVAGAGAGGDAARLRAYCVDSFAGVGFRTLSLSECVPF